MKRKLIYFFYLLFIEFGDNLVELNDEFELYIEVLFDSSLVTTVCGASFARVTLPT